ncbi:MAG: hypothetical protein ACJA0H_002051, partial [Francisellaceae bacterium]
KSIKTVSGIKIKPLVVNELPQPKDKFQVQITFAGGDPKILNLPQTIHAIYPIILQAKPKIIMHGYLDRNTGECNYIIAKQKERKQINTKSVTFGLFGFHVFSIAGQMKRMLGSTGQISRSLSNDVRENLNPRELFKKPDYHKDQEFLASWSHEDVERSVKQSTIFASLFFGIGTLLTILSIIGIFSVRYYFLIPFFALTLFMLQQRYEAKYRQRIKIFAYLWQLIKLKGL